ncbi:hypothetical protein PybrP1_002448 [[Pythium] brassicae (nom. inval.)]|nr:hypothetical protein PybrP1_002448 [[Pythium] brassicae (nom. inval.)]
MEPMVAVSVAPPARRLSAATACANGVFALPRALVSQNKRRFRQGGFDLDLSYVHPRVIVMGYPAVGVELAYRNPRAEVVRFLETRHSDKYFVYNFCAEQTRCYPASVFANRTKCFPIEDHNVPTLEQMLAFCEHAAAWLDADPTRVVALHCKAGKGRAGMMACALLVRMQFAGSALAAVERYNQVRVRDLRGLTVVSQKKWVKYYEQLQVLAPRSPHAAVAEPALVLTGFTIRNALTAVAAPQLRIRVYQLDGATATKTLLHQAVGFEDFALHEVVRGSVLVEFKRVECGNCRVEKHFKIWFNTLFISPDPESGKVIFTRQEMDWVTRDKKKRRIPAALELEMAVARP